MSTSVRSTSILRLSLAVALVVCSAVAFAEEPLSGPPAASPTPTTEPAVASPSPAPPAAPTEATDDARREIRLDFVTETIPRNASLAVAGTEAASRALELAAKPLLGGVLARRDGWGIASRAAWVLWIDMPLGSLGQVLNHEYGHLARYPDDVTQRHVHLRGDLRLGAPMPFLNIGGSADGNWPRKATLTEQLAGQSGGWEADELSLLRSRDMLYAGERTHYVDALSYSITKVNRVFYLFEGTSNLDPRTEEDWHSDPLLYARWLSEIEEGPDYSQEAFKERARSLRRGAYWNLLDYTFWAATMGWAKAFVVNGEHSLPSPWLRIGPIGVAPALAFNLTPIGAERKVLTGLRLGERSADIHVRWTDPLEGRRLVGGGAVLRLGAGKLVQQITVDAWQDRSDTLGGRIEVGGEWRRSRESPIGLRWSLGAKSRGYLTGFSDDPGVYASVGLRARF